jgi:hypothetical protein
MFSKFYDIPEQILTYCGFKKMHPHDTYSIIRVAYKKPVNKTYIYYNLQECIGDSITIYEKIKSEFK